MSKKVQSVKMKSGIITSAVIAILGTIYARVGSERFDRHLHLPLAGWLIGTTGFESRQPANLRILSRLESAPAGGSGAAWLPPEPLSPAEWTRALESLSKVTTQRVFVIEPFAENPLVSEELAHSSSRMVFASFPSRHPEEKGAESLGQIASAPGAAFEGAFLRGFPGALTGDVVLGHVGPWRPYSFVPALKTDAPGDLGVSKHLALVGIPGLKLVGSESEGGDSTGAQGVTHLSLLGKALKLDSHGELYSLPLSPGVVQSLHYPLRSFASDPSEFLKSLKGNETIIIQDRKIWTNSPSLGAELGAVAGIVSSRLSGSFINPSWWTSLYLVLLAAITCAAAFLLDPRRFVLGATVLLGGQALLFPYLLASENLLLPWAPLVLVMLPAAWLGGLWGVRAVILAKGGLRAQLEPAFSPENAAVIATEIETEDFVTRECLGTVLEVNVVGFSSTIENTLPQETTHLLSAFLSPMVNLVHAHRGFLSDYSPERLVAVFGHGVTDSDGIRDHVTQALECAVAIQKKSVELMHVYGVGVMPPFPVRCGINASMVRIGGIEIGSRFELKAIGAGVEVARRLAADCQPFRILMSPSALEILKLEPKSKAQQWALEGVTQVDESSGQNAAFEIDPFDDDRENLAAATELYRSYNQIKREDNRFAFPRGAAPLLMSPVAGESFDLLDFSFTGLRLRSLKYLKLGSEIDLTPAEFDFETSPLRLTVVVHWAAPEVSLPSGREAYILGVRFVKMSNEKLEAVSHYFHEALAEALKGMEALETDAEEAS